MNLFKTPALYSLLVFLFILQRASSQKLDTIKIDNQQSILNNRAFFTFPTGAQNIKRGVDIMSADPNENEETRIVLDIGTMRLVFFARELFTLTDNNFVKTISEQNEEAGYKVKVLTDKEGLQSVLSTPTMWDSTKDAILINDLLVKMTDQSLFQIDAFINPAAITLKNEFQKLTETVFQTLQAGTRMVNRSARREKKGVEGTKTSLLFTLPQDYFITVDQQYDFQVFKIHKYRMLGDTAWQQLVIYAGYHPSSIYSDYGLGEREAKKIKGKFLNKPVEWWNFFIPGENFFDKEQLIPSDAISKGLILHIAMMSNQQKQIDELTKIVEAIQLSN
ncbi:MAG: hypothetical protein J7502_17625 [Flavisolibacter sp.]|nr:hypothetical protein [Flavisolibacter sp.]